MIHKYTKLLTIVTFLVVSAHAEVDAEPTSNCTVNDPDIGESYSGGCMNGFANGEGTAKGRDSYTGSFADGDVHGYGVYEWGPSSSWATERHEGLFSRGKKSGFGTTTLDIDSNHVNIDWYRENAIQADGKFVLRGLFLEHRFVHACESEAGCLEDYLANGSNQNATKSTAVELTRQDFKTEIHKLYLKSSTGEISPEEEEAFLCAFGRLVDKFFDDNDLMSISMVEFEKLAESQFSEQAIQKSFVHCIGETKSISFNALKIDIDSMRGDLVSVRGTAVYLMDQFLLKKGPTGTSIIQVDIEDLDREQKIKILDRCSDVLMGCNVTVLGRIGTVNFELGIIAAIIDFI